MEYICKICGEKIESNTKTEYGQRGAISQKFKKHLKNVHNISLEQYILRFYFNNEIPKCKCGCGNNLIFCEKNALWDPLNSYGKFINCGHVGRNNEQLRNKLKEQYKSKFDNYEWLKNHYYNEYGEQTIKDALNDFLYNNELTNVDIGKKYGIDYRTLTNIWRKLNLLSEEQYLERSKYRKFQLSGKRRRKTFDNAPEICQNLFNLIKTKQQEFTITSLINYWNENNLNQIETDPFVVLSYLENLYGNEIYEYLQFGRKSKEEQDFCKVLKFFISDKFYKFGKRLQHGKNKRESYIYDICINNKYIIEYDGEGYYHQNKEYDKIKEDFAISKGYKILRISYKDFKNPLTFIKIKKWLNND
jgi:very-short-patch-repair endonuclease